MLNKFKELYEEGQAISEERKSLKEMSLDLDKREANLIDKLKELFQEVGKERVMNDQLEMFVPSPKDKYTEQDVDKAIEFNKSKVKDVTLEPPTDLPTLIREVKQTRFIACHNKNEAAKAVGLSGTCFGRCERYQDLKIAPRASTIRAMKKYLIEFNPNYSN